MRDIFLGYNVSDNGVYTPAIGDVVRGTTATYIAQDGLLKTAPPNVARVDYTNGVDELLLEPSSTNTYAYSSGLTFLLGRCSRGQGKIILGGVNGFEYSLTSGSPYITTATNDISLGFRTLSLYVNGNDSDYFSVRLATSSNAGYGGRITFVPSTETLTISENSTYVRNTSGRFENLGNKIYRLILTTEFISATSVINTYIYFGDYSNVFLGGLQLEKLNNVTSYIPTDGATATRSADKLTDFGSNQIIDSNSGLLLFEGSAFNNDLMYIALNNNADVGGYCDISLRFQGDNITSRRTENYTPVSSVTENIDVTKNIKIVNKYNLNDNELWINGSFIGSLSYSGSALNLNNLDFNYSALAYPFYGRVRQVKHLPYNTDISKL